MYFLEDTCMPYDDSEISYYEDALEIGVLNHKASLIIDSYDQILYQEDGDSKKPDGVFEKIKSAILNLLDKIDSIIRGFLDGMSSSKNRLTADKYMHSETAKIRLTEDLFAIQKDIDKEYLRLRPIVSKISNMTGADITEVARVSDSVTDTLKLIGTAAAPTVKRVVYRKAINKLSDQCVGKMKDVQKWRSETEASVNRLKRGDEKEPEKLKAMQKFANALANLTNAYKHVGEKAKKAVTNVVNRPRANKIAKNGLEY